MHVFKKNKILFQKERKRIMYHLMVKMESKYRYPFGNYYFVIVDICYTTVRIKTQTMVVF